MRKFKIGDLVETVFDSKIGSEKAVIIAYDKHTPESYLLEFINPHPERHGGAAGGKDDNGNKVLGGKHQHCWYVYEPRITLVASAKQKSYTSRDSLVSVSDDAMKHQIDNLLKHIRS